MISKFSPVKRILSLVLVLCLMLSFVPVTARAEDGNEPQDTVTQETPAPSEQEDSYTLSIESVRMITQLLPASACTFKLQVTMAEDTATALTEATLFASCVDDMSATVDAKHLPATQVTRQAPDSQVYIVTFELPQEMVHTYGTLRLHRLDVSDGLGGEGSSGYETQDDWFDSVYFGRSYAEGVRLENIRTNTPSATLSDEVHSLLVTVSADVVVEGQVDMSAPYFTMTVVCNGIGQEIQGTAVQDPETGNYSVDFALPLRFSCEAGFYSVSHAAFNGEQIPFSGDISFELIKTHTDRTAPVLKDVSFALDGVAVEPGFVAVKGLNEEISITFTVEDASAITEMSAYINYSDYDHVYKSVSEITGTGPYTGTVTLSVDALQASEHFLHQFTVIDYFDNSSLLIPENTPVLRDCAFFVAESEDNIPEPFTYNYQLYFSWCDAEGSQSANFDAVGGRFASVYDLVSDLPAPNIPGATLLGWYVGGEIITPDGGGVPGRGGYFELYPVYDKAVANVTVSYRAATGGFSAESILTVIDKTEDLTIQDMLNAAAQQLSHYPGSSVKSVVYDSETPADTLLTPVLYGIAGSVVYNDALVNVQYNYIDAEGNLQYPQTEGLLVPAGSTVEEVLTLFAQAHADLPHDPRMNFTGWRCENHSDLTEAAAEGNYYSLSPVYDAQQLRIQYYYWQSGYRQDLETALYLPSSATYGDAMDQFMAEIAGTVSHDAEMGYTGSWFAVNGEETDTPVDFTRTFQLAANYTQLPVWISWSFVNEDLSVPYEDDTVMLPANATAQDIQDYFLENYAPNAAHAEALTLASWKRVDLNADAPLIISNSFTFAPVYTQPVVQVTYSYIPQDSYDELSDSHLFVLEPGDTIADLKAAYAEFAADFTHSAALGSYAWVWSFDYEDDTALEALFSASVTADPDTPCIYVNYHYSSEDGSYPYVNAVVPYTEGMTVADALSFFTQTHTQVGHDPDLGFTHWVTESPLDTVLEDGYNFSVAPNYSNMPVYVEYTSFVCDEFSNSVYNTSQNVTIYVPIGSTYADLKQIFAAKNLGTMDGRMTPQWVWQDYPNDSDLLYEGTTYYANAQYTQTPVWFSYFYFDANGDYQAKNDLVIIPSGTLCDDVLDLFVETTAAGLTHAESLGDVTWTVSKWWSDDRTATYGSTFTFAPEYENGMPEETNLVVYYYASYGWDYSTATISSIEDGMTYLDLLNRHNSYGWYPHHSSISLTGWEAKGDTALTDAVKLYQGDVVFVALYDKLPVSVSLEYLDENGHIVQDSAELLLPTGSTYQDLLDALTLPDASEQCPERIFDEWVMTYDGDALTDPVVISSNEPVMELKARYQKKYFSYQLTYWSLDEYAASTAGSLFIDADADLTQVLNDQENFNLASGYTGYDLIYLNDNGYDVDASYAVRYEDRFPVHITTHYIDNYLQSSTGTYTAYIDGSLDTTTAQQLDAAVEEIVRASYDAPEELTIQLYRRDKSDFSGDGKVCSAEITIIYDKSVLYLEFPHGIDKIQLHPVGTTVDLPLTFNGQAIVWDVTGTSITLQEPHHSACAYYADSFDSTCGENTTWELYGSSGLLHLYGTGDVTSAPWLTDDLKPYIRTVYLNEISSLCAGAFAGCTNLTTVWVGDTAIPLGENAFSGVTATLRYPCTGTGYTEGYMQPYGGELTWVAHHEYLDGTCTQCGGEDPYKDLNWYVNGDSTGSWVIIGRYSGEEATLVIPETILGYPVRYIDSQAFWWNGTVTSITIPATVEAIDYSAFYGSCATTIIFLGDAPSFGSDCFAAIQGGGTVYYPHGNDTWYEGILDDYRDYGLTAEAYCTLTDGVPGHNWIAATCAAAKTCSVCGKTEGAPHSFGSGTTCTVCGLTGGYCGDTEYGDGTNLSWVLDGNTLIIVGTGNMDRFEAYKSPWYEARNEIKHVMIHDGVTSLGSWAFSQLGITSIEIPDTITSIEEYAFAFCDINSIEIPDSVTYIGENAFQSSSITSVEIPDSVTYIGDHAFYSCSSLTGIYVDENNANYSSDSHGVLFNKDKSVLLAAPGTLSGAYTIPNTVTQIGSRAFENCLELTGVIFPDTLASIGDFAFCNCQKLTNVILPKQLTNLGAYSFYCCHSLTEITIPAGVTTIQEGTFGFCDHLVRVTLNNNISSIEGWAFSNCFILQEIRIPANVTTIGANAFSYCNALNTVIFEGSAPSVGNAVFLNAPATVYYPASDPTWAEAIMSSLGESAYLTWKEQQPLTLNGQPASTSAYSGDTAKVTVSATGDGLTYQWYFKNPGAAKFSLTTSFTGNSYSIKMDASRAGRQVYCVITDQYGNSVTTETVTLSMRTKLAVTTQPESVKVAEGATAKVTVGATGDGLTYQWYYKNPGASKFSLTTSFTGNSYSVAMDDSRNGRQVYCVITDQYGNSVTTETVTLSMRTKLAITTQPESVKVAEGATAKVTVGATGDGLTYQWYFRNAGASKFSLTTSFKGNSYSVAMDDSRNGRQVYCVITDKYGTSVQTETVTLSMRTKLAITTQPKTTYTKQGATVKVTIGAVGDGLTYTWYVKNAGASTWSKSSIKTNTYSVKMSATTKDRQVYCVVTDKYGNTVETGKVYLRMAATVTTQPKTAYAKQGASVSVTVKAAGDGLTYQWYVKGAYATKYTKSSVTKATYTATMSSTTKDRYVYCVITDAYGNSVKTNTVRLRMAATVTAQPKTTYTKQGATASVTVKAAGDGLTYTWYVKNAGATKWTKSSITKATYSVKMSATTKNRLVYCVITDQYGNTVETNKVYLRMAATVTKQPASVTVAKGVTAKTTVTAVGDGLTYTWYVKNAGATKWTKSSITKSAYSVKMSATTNGRQVYCVVTDQYGNTVKTSTVTLKMS